MTTPLEIEILAVSVGNKTVVQFIPLNVNDGRAASQEVGGGGICCHAIGSDLKLNANDDGLLHQLPYNRCGFAGHFGRLKALCRLLDVNCTKKKEGTE